MLPQETLLLRTRRALSSGLAVALAFAIQIAVLGLASSSAQATRIGDGGEGGECSHECIRGHGREWRRFERGFGDHDLPGLTLDDLVDGASFESANGTLTFADFEVVTEGVAPEDLGRYRIVPVADGFKLFSPLFGFDGGSGSLSLGYTVTAADGLQISSADFSVLGVAFKANTELTAEFFSMGGASVGDLMTAARLHGYGTSSDSALFDPGFVKLVVDELVSIDSDCFGALKHIDHRFHTISAEVVPEPSTALLLGLGLVSMATVRRRQTQAR